MEGRHALLGKNASTAPGMLDPYSLKMEDDPHHLDPHRSSEPSMSRKRTPSMTKHKSNIFHPANEDILLEPLHAGQVINIGNFGDSPVDNVRKLVEQYTDDSVKPMFCELMELSTTREDDDVAWRE
uniref:Uncharacterized protein n=1 Tax=Plectus sambesii TaxID=2011161 RepID=A0A914WCU5_9BILA